MRIDLLPTAFILIPLAAIFAYLAWSAEKEVERVEQLAARLRRLCESSGRPGIGTRRPRRLSLDVHMAIQSLDKSLRSLERDQGSTAAGHPTTGCSCRADP
ncbi:MAG: hypothetical protein OXG13_21685 [Gemmatimonadaceae bacterium]|nr:hypothetical protein [Gemmatimonadaceae bacterium]